MLELGLCQLRKPLGGLVGRFLVPRKAVWCQTQQKSRVGNRMNDSEAQPTAKRHKVGSQQGGLRPFQIMVATTQSHGIGWEGKLPWKTIPADMAYFKHLTSKVEQEGRQNAVIMGRKTWEGLPDKFKPLSDRLNVVLSRSADGDVGKMGVPDGVQVCGSLERALEMLGKEPYSLKVEQVFVIGGGQVYKQAVNMDACEVIHLTRVDADFKCDAFFPEIDPAKYRIWSSSEPTMERKAKPHPVKYSFLTYVRTENLEAPRLPPGIKCQHGETQYLNMIRDIIENGAERGDRTGTGTRSLFGQQMRFDLRNSFPLLTTKRVFWRGVVEELLWFISGSTNAKILSDKGIKIWEKNGSLDFLKSVGLENREESDLGPVYGFQWRHFGAKYVDMHTDYSGQGVDQLADVIKTIKRNPNDRRIVMSAWNPEDLGLMALPPCHMFCQFYVAGGELSCQMYQRSADMGLGVPFNIASYALLTCMIAHVCKLKPGSFVHTLGDAHVYLNHIEPLKEQLDNSPRIFPVLQLNLEVEDIDSFTSADIKLDGYYPHKKIAMEMAV